MAAQLAASQEGLRSVSKFMNLVSKFNPDLTCFDIYNAILRDADHIGRTD
jgi:hypothetical protein